MTAKHTHWLESTSIFSAEFLQDPYPAYHELQRYDPVHWDSSSEVWLLTAYNDVLGALRDPRLKSDNIGGYRNVNKAFNPLIDLMRDMILFADNPKHARIRRLINGAFARSRVETMELLVQQVVDELLDSFEAPRSTGSTWDFRSRDRDFVGDFAVPLPIAIIAHIMGIPLEDRRLFKTWCDDVSVVVSTPVRALDESELVRRLRNGQQLVDYLTDIIRETHSKPREDLLSAMVLAKEQDERLDARELLANALLLLVAGNETTTNLIANGALALLEHPEALEYLRQQPAAVPAAIEEMLRFQSPSQFLTRTAAEDLEIRGKRISSGQLIYLMLGAANRDPSVFENPDRFDIQRSGPRHLAFGSGAHACVGAGLARLEARVAFSTLLSRFPKLALKGGRPSYRGNFNLRSVESLTVSF